MLKVLVNAYGCSPYKGSEAGLGWLWATQLSQYVDLWIITEAESKDDVLKVLPCTPNRERLHFTFVDIGEKARQMCWNQGDWRFYYFYDKYQKKVFEIAKQLHEEVHFDIVHHLNMICYREPSYLWKLKDCKYVWGPVGGLNKVPSAFLSELGFKKHSFYVIKNLLNKILFKYNSKVRSAMKRTDVLIAAQKSGFDAIKKVYGIEPLIINETGMELQEKAEKKSKSSGTLKIVWVGRMIPTKLLNLAIKTIYACKDLDIEMHILGDGQCKKEAEILADKLGINDIIIWHGLVSKDKVQNILDESDLFFFTSIVEGTSHAVMEAIAHNLPVLCFDTCAHGSIINEKMGFKIPLTTPTEAIANFETIIRKVYQDRSLLGKASQCEPSDLAYLSWEKKIESIVGIYNRLVENSVSREK